MPVDTEDFIDRDLDKLDEYRAAERDLQGLRVEILGLEARIVASRPGCPRSIRRRSTPKDSARSSSTRGRDRRTTKSN